MHGALLALLILFVSPSGSSFVPGQAPSPAECDDWQTCRAQVEEAIRAGAFERAHDLAWRTVQRGPKDDAALMYLLARAQCLSGRPHDALVMVRRLAERGIATDAATSPDLERTRALPGWPDVQALVERAGAIPSAALPGTGAAVSAPSAPPTRAPEAKGEPSDRTGAPGGTTSAAPVSHGGARLEATAPAEETIRFSSGRFVTAGLAYDAVSHRFVLGDRDGRKVRVVGEGLDEAVDLVRAESAGFSAIRALAIDPRRGDLWVASADGAASGGALHRLQLISGRPLKSFPLGAEGATSPDPVDVAVTAAGAVLVLDRAGRLARLAPGAAAFDAAMDLGLQGVTSIATGTTETRVFVAHRDGIARVDLSTGVASALGAPDGVSLSAFLRLRAYRGGLIGLQSEGDGTARLVRLGLEASARRVRTATAFDTRIDTTDGVVALAVSGDEVALVGDPPAAEGSAGGSTPAAAALMVRRLRLQ